MREEDEDEEEPKGMEPLPEKTRQDAQETETDPSPPSLWVEVVNEAISDKHTKRNDSFSTASFIILAYE